MLAQLQISDDKTSRASAELKSGAPEDLASAELVLADDERSSRKRSSAMELMRMQRRQLEARDVDPGGGMKRSRLTAACHALAVRLGCAAREPRGGGAANEKGSPRAPSGEWSPRPTDGRRLEGGREGVKGGGGEGDEVNPQVGGMGAAPPRFTPSTLCKQVCGAN